jgi:hypothetical protein
MRKVASDLGELVDIIRYRHEATLRFLRYRVRKPQWLQRIVDHIFDVARSLRGGFHK